MTRKWLSVVLLPVCALLATVILGHRANVADQRIHQLERITVEQTQVIVGLSEDVHAMCRVLLTDGRCTIKAAP